MGYNGPIGYDGRPSMWDNAALVKWGPVVIPRRQDVNTLGLNLTVAALDPSNYGDHYLNAQKFIAVMDNQQALFESMVGGVDDFGPSYVIPMNGNNNGNPSINPFGSMDPVFGPGVTNPFAPSSVYGPSGVYMPNGNNPLNPWDNGGYGGVGISSLPNGGVLTAPDADNPSALLNSRLSLMEKYCDKYGKIVDIDKIRSEYSSNPEEGVEYCDEIINTRFDQSKLRKIVHKEYEEFLKAKENAGKGVADQWVDAIIKQGLAPLNISAGGVSKNNVLDVIGAFAMNEEVRNGKVSLYNVMESPEVTSGLIRALKEKADDALLGDELDDREKEQVEKYISSLTFHYDKYAESLEDDNARNDVAFRDVRKKIALDYMKLFSILRISEAKHNDSVAPQYFGLPQDSSIKFEDQTQRAYKECEHKGTPKLKTII